MSGKKFKTYCRIIDYVEAVDPELYDLLHGTCTDISLSSTKGKPGTTFLLPQDKTFRKKVSDLAYSSNVEDANKASDMLNALIIRDVFKTPSDWLAKKDDIPNSLFPSQHVEIDSVSNGKEVIFKSGAKATLDADFQDSSRKSNLAVWKLTGDIPVTTDKLAKFKYTKVKRNKKVGSYDAGSIQSRTNRFKIAIAVENAYVLNELSKRGGSNHKDNVYLRHTLSLIQYILTKWGGSGDPELLYNKVLPLISFDHLDFYLLIEPHKFGGPYLLDDVLIDEWWLNKSMNFDIKETLKKIESLFTKGSNALIYSDRAEILNKIADMRQRYTHQIDARPRSICEELAKEYAEFEKNNSIGGLQPIYPQDLAAYYASEPGLKLLHDELRYLTYGAFKRLEDAPQFDMGQFHELVNMIGEYLHAKTSDERERVLCLLNKHTLRFQIAPTEKCQEIKTFINSTMFMFIPLTQDEANTIKQKYSTSRPMTSNTILFNIQKDVYMRHNRLLSSTPGGDLNQDVATMLETLDVNSLDPELKKRLIAKLGL